MNPKTHTLAPFPINFQHIVMQVDHEKPVEIEYDQKTQTLSGWHEVPEKITGSEALFYGLAVFLIVSSVMCWVMILRFLWKKWGS